MGILMAGDYSKFSQSADLKALKQSILHGLKGTATILFTDRNKDLKKIIDRKYLHKIW